MFLGPCAVCAKICNNYNAVSSHLRHKFDEDHKALSMQYRVWLSQYRALLRCRKCGMLFEIQDKSKKNTKTCPSCRELKALIGKRQYEKMVFCKPKDPRTHSTAKNSKSCFPLGYQTEVCAADFQQPVQKAIADGDGVVDIIRKFGITYNIVHKIAKQHFGDEGYATWVHQKRVSTIHRNREKARVASGLQKKLVAQMSNLNLSFSENIWTTVLIDGVKVHREIDIKVIVDVNRKLLVLCDGEIYHGPKCLYATPADKIENDRKTAMAFFAIG